MCLTKTAVRLSLLMRPNHVTENVDDGNHFISEFSICVSGFMRNCRYVAEQNRRTKIQRNSQL